MTDQQRVAIEKLLVLPAPTNATLAKGQRWDLMKREARSIIEHEQRFAPELWERTMSRRHFIAAAGAGGGLLLLPRLAEKASAGRPSTGVAACRSCGKSIVIEWNEAFLQGVRDSKLGPPMVARALAIGHTCMYEAWAAYDHRAVGTLLGSALRQPPAKRTLANKNQAISFAAYRAAVDLFPVSKSLVFDPLMQTLGYDPDDLSTDTSTATGIGNIAAKAVLDVRHSDGANQLGDEPGGIAGVPYSDYTGYTPVNGPMDLRVPFDPTVVHDLNAWQPLRYVDASGNVVTPAFVGAQWQRVTPFALGSPSQLRSSTGPATYGSVEYRAQAQALLDLSSGLTDEQKMIAEYWADGPNSELPPGHWNLFAQFVSRREQHGPDERGIDSDVKLFFALTNAVFDAGMLRVGQQARVQLSAPDHGHPLPLPRTAGASLGRPVPGHEADRRRDLVPVPADHLPHAALPRILLRAQQFQRRRRRDPQALHRAAIASAAR